MVKMSHIWHNSIPKYQNIKLTSFYSKSVSRENSKCVDFASVQLKHILQNSHFSSHSKQNEKMSHIWHNDIPRASKKIKLVSRYPKSVSRESPKCVDFLSVEVKHIAQNRPFFLSCQTEWKNESYSTQWHIKNFQNIKLVCL